MPIQSAGASVGGLRLIAWTRIPRQRMSRAVAIPMPPKPRMPQTPPASMRFGVNWLNSPRARAACSGKRRFAAASVMARACSAIGSA